MSRKASSPLARLTVRSLRAGRMTVAVLAIALAAVLFTGLFTVAMNVLTGYEQSAMRAIGTYGHAGVKHVTLDEYQLLAADGRWTEAGCSIMAGDAVGDGLAKLPTEVRWADENYAEMGYCLPTAGRMPLDEKDLATSRLVLKALGVSDELGAEVPLSIRTDTGTVTDTFTLCGVWDGDTAAGAQEVWLSREYVERIAPVRRGSSQGWLDDGLSGFVGGTFLLPSSWQLESRARAIFADRGLEELFHFNYAYASSSVTVQDALPVLAAAGLVLAAGYLLITNIFTISLAQDIRSYGLLKTLGATAKQLRRLVYGKALRLSALGIPLGLALGWVLGTALSPAVLGSMTLPEDISARSASPAIFLAGAVFTLLTVLASCFKPARTAGKVSPMEALRWNEAAVSGKMSRRAARPVSPVRMAWRNLGRGRKKAAAVTMSLALSLVILNSVAAVAGGFDFEKFTADSLVTDFAVADAGIISGMGGDARLTAVDGTLRAGVAALPGLEGMGNVYMCFADQPIGEELAGVIRKAGQNETVAQAHMYQLAAAQLEGQAMGPANEENVYTYGNMIYSLYGLDDFAAGKLTVLEGEPDMDKWRAGQGVFITPAVLWGGGYCLYHPGDTMTVDFTEPADGDYRYDKTVERVTKTYEVLAVVERPSAYSCGTAMGSGTCVILPEEEYLAQVREELRAPMMTVFDVDDEHLAGAESFCQNYTENVDPSLNYRSRVALAEEYRGFLRMFALVGGSLCALLGLIGILNYVNSMTTSILTRRRELAMLQAVGMTAGQVRRMLVAEGLGFALMGLSAALVLATGVHAAVLRPMTADMTAFTVRFSLTPVLLAAVPLLAVTALTPWLCCRRMVREPLVERLRAAE